MKPTCITLKCKRKDTIRAYDAMDSKMKGMFLPLIIPWIYLRSCKT
jgi:hypothetical protein